MTKINDSRATVTLFGVTNQRDLLLRSLWLNYADALGPFDYVAPQVVGEKHRPNVETELLAVHRAIYDIKTVVNAMHEASAMRDAIRLWLRAVDACGGFHGIRQPFCRIISKHSQSPIGPYAAECLLRSRVDDAMVRLEGGHNAHYTECFDSVAADLIGFMTPTEWTGFQQHARGLLAAHFAHG